MARRNVALPANGGTASAETIFNASYPAAGAVNGNRTTGDWGSGGGWSGLNGYGLPQWWQVDFSGLMAIDEVDIVTYGSATAPSLTTPVNGAYGATAWTIQRWTSGSWVTIETVTGNAFVWRQFSYTPFNTTKLRVSVTAAPDNTPRLIEVETWGDDAPSGPGNSRGKGKSGGLGGKKVFGGALWTPFDTQTCWGS
jgi:hypothetical protein